MADTSNRTLQLGQRQITMNNSRLHGDCRSTTRYFGSYQAIQGGAREDLTGWVVMGTETLQKTIRLVKLTVKARDGSFAGSATPAGRLLMICLQFFIWFSMIALGRGFGLPDEDDTPVAHGSLTPRNARLMASSTRSRQIAFLLMVLTNKVRSRQSIRNNFIYNNV